MSHSASSRAAVRGLAFAAVLPLMAAVTARAQGFASTPTASIYSFTDLSQVANLSASFCARSS